VYVVDNAGDDLAAVRHLNACSGPADGRAVLRPTPGASDVATLGWDLLVAAGKPPHAARREHVSGLSWQLGQAWLAGFAVTDMIVDRAHLLTRDQADTAAAAKAGATLWLLWGTGIGPRTPGCDGPPHLVAGQRTQVLSLWEFYQRLPTARPPAAAEPGQPGSWPPLPAADFPTFLAACRRYLPRGEFAQVARLYYGTAEATDAWLDSCGAPRDAHDGHITAGFEAALTGWLRDSAIGPAPCGPAALVRLRAVQAALFVRAIVLTWQPDALGPQPATRLPGNLTAQVAGALATAVRTDAAAATALSVHLNQGPAFFGVLQMSDIAPDGSAIRVPAGRAPAFRPGITPGAGGWYGQVLEEDQRSWRELATAEPIRIPGCAWPLFAAHLAYRRASGVAGSDPTSSTPATPGTRRIGLDLPWMHADDCRYGTDIGLTWRGQGWLAEPGLRLARTGPGQDQAITPPRARPCPRPYWVSGSPP
jgi:hypothetical protein